MAAQSMQQYNKVVLLMVLLVFEITVIQWNQTCRFKENEMLRVSILVVALLSSQVSGFNTKGILKKNIDTCIMYSFTKYFFDKLRFLPTKLGGVQNKK